MLRYLQGSDFFISYSRSDGRGFTVALANALQQKGFNCFIDMLDTQPGASTPTTVIRNLKQSSVLVVVTTSAAQRSQNVGLEIKLFLEKERPVILIGPPIDQSGGCVWTKLVTGMPVNIVSDVQLGRSEVDVSLVNLVVNTLAYRRQRKRIQRSIVVAVLVLISLIVTAVAITFYFQNRIAQQTKELEQTSADLKKNQGVLTKTNQDLAANQAKLSMAGQALTKSQKVIKIADQDGLFLYKKVDSLVKFIDELKLDEDHFLDAFEKMQADQRAADASSKQLYDEKGFAIASVNKEPSIVIFDRNSSVLRTVYYPVLDRLASVGRSDNATFEVRSYASKVGFGDEEHKIRKLKWGLDRFYFPISTSAYSMALSKDRANSVKTYFVNSGMPAAKVRVKYMGTTRNSAALHLFSYDWVEIVRVSN